MRFVNNRFTTKFKGGSQKEVNGAQSTRKKIYAPEKKSVNCTSLEEKNSKPISTRGI